MSEGERTSLVVEATRPRERLDRWMHEHFPHLSRGAFQRLIVQGHLRVGGRVVKPTHMPRAGEVVTIDWPPPEPLGVEAEEIALEVLYEDERLLVVNKPAGMAVHPSAGHDTGTLVHALLHHCRGCLSGIGGVERPGIVHRLDLDTSGCLVVAKDDATHLALSGQFAGREVEKTYMALVVGHPLPEAGDIRVAIGRHPTHRKRMAVTEGGGGREAWTEYRTVERLPEASLVEVRLHTGRTHQIRVHFKHIRCPLVGDEVYGPRQNRRLELEAGVRAGRQMLHAWRLAFLHPGDGRRMEFEAPWPGDFRDILERLR
ncbi:MAG: RluA family pseudouridine synthase [Limisphaerales bacterium]|jgi:23S rRNA pseudouridine1911/1915/1917 synthase